MVLQDDCFKIKNGGMSAVMTPHIEGGNAQTGRSQEELDRLRIPSFPVSIRKEEYFN
jgi:hypothetical protein